MCALDFLVFQGKNLDIFLTKGEIKKKKLFEKELAKTGVRSELEDETTMGMGFTTYVMGFATYVMVQSKAELLQIRTAGGPWFGLVFVFIKALAPSSGQAEQSRDYSEVCSLELCSHLRIKIVHL